MVRMGGTMIEVKGVEELRQAALAKTRAEEYDEALALYDAALAVAETDEQQELITINKADALVAIERNGPEVQALPAILMRRRNPHHTFLAAYTLTFKQRLQKETKRGIFYGQVALDAAKEADEPFWKLAVLNELGILYETDSQFSRAIEAFTEALALIDSVRSGSDQQFGETAIIQNLGYNKLLVGETKEGIRLLLSILDKVEGQETLCDAYTDLCYGYIDIEEYDTARYYGEIGLKLAIGSRQVRNAHYLMGEAAYKSGDIEAAEFHFDKLSEFYPEFRNLKSLLYAIDLRSMVNLKL